MVGKAVTVEVSMTATDVKVRVWPCAAVTAQETLRGHIKACVERRYLAQYNYTRWGQGLRD